MKSKLRGVANETFSSLRYRNFRLFFGGQLISQVGNWLTLVAQTLLVLKLTDSGVAVGLLTACQFAPVLLFGAWAGLVADRSDKRKLLIIVQSFAMAQSFALAALAFMRRPAGAARSTPSLRRRRRDGVRQPGPPGVRRRDGARGRRATTRSASTAR